MASVADLYAVCGFDATDLRRSSRFHSGFRNQVRFDDRSLCRQEEKPALSLPMVRAANEESPT